MTNVVICTSKDFAEVRTTRDQTIARFDNVYRACEYCLGHKDYHVCYFKTLDPIEPMIALY